jgi:hypothetical protein
LLIIGTLAFGVATWFVAATMIAFRRTAEAKAAIKG